MPTYRGFKKNPFRCGNYEAQDVLAEVDNVDLISLQSGKRRKSWETYFRTISCHDVPRRLLYLNPGLQKVRLTREYDLFIALCQDYFEIAYVNAIENWKDHCKTSVCWIDELWAVDIPGYKYWLHVLSQFDHIFRGFARECRFII